MPPSIEAEAAERESNTRRAYREIRARILSGDMLPDSQYLEQQLAEMLGMSRTPVREALIRLADERLVEVRPRHGARVLPVTETDVAEIYELIAELEGLAARRLAAQRPTAALMAPIETAHADMEAAMAASDKIAWFRADWDFHAAIVSACGNTRLIAIVTSLTDQIYWARQCSVPHHDISERSRREHNEIVAALKAADGDAAARLVCAHRMEGGRAMQELLRASRNRR